MNRIVYGMFAAATAGHEKFAVYTFAEDTLSCCHWSQRMSFSCLQAYWRSKVVLQELKLAGSGPSYANSSVESIVKTLSPLCYCLAEEQHVKIQTQQKKIACKWMINTEAQYK